MCIFFKFETSNKIREKADKSHQPLSVVNIPKKKTSSV